MKNRRVTSAPIEIQLLITKNCNLKCVYCSATELQNIDKEPELTNTEWVNLLTRLKKINVFKITFSGGEPFMRDDFLNILAKAKDLNFPTISLNTNGTLITEEVAKELKKINTNKINVSLDGDEEANDNLRGVGSFQKSSLGIENLVKEGIIPEILYTPLRSNYKKLYDMTGLLQLLGVREINFNSLHPTGRSKDKYNEIILDPFVEINKFQLIIDETRKKYNNIRIAEGNTFYKNLPIRYYNYKNKITLDKPKQVALKPCSAAHASCNITSSGWVIPCSEWFDFRGGNIRDQDILDIWRNSKEFQEIRNISKFTTAQIPYCRNCPYNIFCHAMCRADAYNLFADLLAPDPFCPFWRIR